MNIFLENPLSINCQGNLTGTTISEHFCYLALVLLHCQGRAFGGQDSIFENATGQISVAIDR